MSSPAALTRFVSRLLPSFEKPRVYVVFMEFTPAHRTPGCDILRALLARTFPGHQVAWTIVDNAYLRDEDVPPHEGADVIAGDRSSREFSGLDAGIAYVRRKHRPAPRSVFVLANDTFHRSYGTDYLDGFERRALRGALRRNMAVGYVDCYPSEIRVLGLPLRCWIRTSLVFLTARTLDAIGKLALPVPDDEVFGGPEQFFREAAPLSENYRRYLQAWLFGTDEDDFKYHWHSARPLTPENFSEFKAKARSIMCEHYLSARLEALGVPIFRVNGRSRRRER